MPRAMPAPEGALCSNRPRGHKLVLVKKDDLHLWHQIKRRVTTDWEGNILADEECSAKIPQHLLKRKIPDTWPNRVICHFYDTEGTDTVKIQGLETKRKRTLILISLTKILVEKYKNKKSIKQKMMAESIHHHTI